MAIGIQNFDNPEAPSAAEPSGGIRDNTGINDGTKINKKSYSDIHQFFAKLLRLAGLTPNNTFDNEINGFQYMQAADARWYQRQFSSLQTFDGSSSLITSGGRFSPFIRIVTSAGGGGLSLAAGAENLDVVTFKNYRATSISISLTSVTVEGVSSFSVASGKCVTLMYDQANTDWIIVNSF